MGDPLDQRADVTEGQLVSGFFWAYKGICSVLGSDVQAKRSDFQDLGKAWVDLARKVPFAALALSAIGPLFSLTDLFDKLAVAWDMRTRFRGPRTTPPPAYVPPAEGNDGAAGPA